MMSDEAYLQDWATMAGVQALLDSVPLHRLLGFQLVDFAPDEGELSISAAVGENAERLQGTGQAHGGMLAVMIDTTATFAVSAMVGRALPTANLRIDFLRPAIGSKLIARAKVRRAGRSLGVIDVDIECDGKLVALGRCTQVTGN